jgi:hypothetical protein
MQAMMMKRKRVGWILVYQVDSNSVVDLSSKGGTWIHIVYKEHQPVQVAIDTEGGILGACTDWSESPVVLYERGIGVGVHGKHRN